MTLDDPLENKGGGFESAEICKALSSRVSLEHGLCPTSRPQQEVAPVPLLGAGECSWGWGGPALSLGGT